jgi:hypothetical protein
MKISSEDSPVLTLRTLLGDYSNTLLLKVQQKLFPQPFQVEELFVEVTRALA